MAEEATKEETVENVITTNDGTSILLTDNDTPKEEDEETNGYNWFGKDKPKIDDDDDDDDDDYSDDEDPSDKSVGDAPNAILPGQTLQQPDVGMIARAVQAGLKPDQIQSLTRTGGLQDTIEVLEATKSQSPGGEVDQGPKKFELDLDPEEYDEGVIESLNKMNDYHFEQVKALHDELKSLREERSSEKQQTEQQKEQEFLFKVDKRFASLHTENEAYGDIFGNKVAAEMNDKDEEARQQFANRVAVVQEMRRQRQAHPDKTDNEIMDIAIRVALPNEVTKIAESTVKAKVKRHRETRVSSRSTSKKGSTRTVDAKERGTKNAESWLKGRLKKLGLG